MILFWLRFFSGMNEYMVGISPISIIEHTPIVYIYMGSILYITYIGNAMETGAPY